MFFMVWLLEELRELKGLQTEDNCDYTVMFESSCLGG